MLLALLVWLLIIVVIGYVAFWFIDQGLPAPINMVAKIIVVIIALVAILQLFTGTAHFPGIY